MKHPNPTGLIPADYRWRITAHKHGDPMNGMIVGAFPSFEKGYEALVEMEPSDFEANSLCLDWH